MNRERRLRALDEANLVLDRPGQVNVFLVAGLSAPGASSWVRAALVWKLCEPRCPLASPTSRPCDRFLYESDFVMSGSFESRSSNRTYDCFLPSQAWMDYNGCVRT